MDTSIDNKASFNCAVEWGNSTAEKGEVFTKPEIVKLMLETSGITREILNPNTRILEPSCGQGEFVNAIARALCEKLANAKFESVDVEQFQNLIRAFDISANSLNIAKLKTEEILRTIFSHEESALLVKKWYQNADFLVAEPEFEFTHAIGNPPYVRIENIPSYLLNKYRCIFSTMVERADLYIAFYEKSLSLLANNGVLSFICTDRWTKNRYGAALRDYIARSFQLDLFVDLYGQNAFQSDVLTYPAITQISKQKHQQSIIIHNPLIDDNLSDVIQKSLAGNDVPYEGKVTRKDLLRGNKAWLFGTADELRLIQRLESQYPLIEETGCRIFIGAATGNNKVYVVGNDIDLEPCRKLPMVKASDIKNGKLINGGNYIINTYDENGVIDISNYPKLQKYLESHKETLKARHIAKNSPANWYKTIDRVYPERAIAEKLLIPDIKSQLTVIYDDIGFHPNNSIYYICSDSWDLRALQGVLISGLGQLFVEMYSTKVSGGNLRFQAQHLRKIRLPMWDDISQYIKVNLIEAAKDNDVMRAKEAVCCLYDFTKQERQILGC